MRIRTVKPEFHQHEGLATLPREDRLLAVALLNWADDDGYFRSHSALVAGALFPFDADGRAFVTRGLAHLVDARFIKLFEGGIGHILKFSEHQVINKKTKSRLAEKAVVAISAEVTCRTPVVLPEDSHTEVEVEVEVEQGSGGGRGTPVAKAPEVPRPPLPAMPEDRFASPESFWAWVQHKRHEVGHITEKRPHPQKLSSWWSEVHLELNGDPTRLEQALYRFAEDPHWESATPSMPFNAFMSEWRKYVPQARRAS